MRADDRHRIRDHFAASAGPYRDHWAPLLAAFAAPLLEWIPEASQDGAARTVLDLGCGPGVVTAAALLRCGTGARVVGADLVAEMLGRLREQLPRVHAVRVDAARLPFRDHVFDLALSTFMLQHVREQHRTAAELFRILHPGGVLLSATWGRNDPGCGAFDVWEETLLEFGAPSADPDPARRWDDTIDTPGALRGLFASAGFAVLRLEAVAPAWTWTPGGLEAVRTTLGAPSRRYRMLPGSRQGAFLSEVRRRLTALEAPDFAWEPEVLLAVARRPEDAGSGGTGG